MLNTLRRSSGRPHEQSLPVKHRTLLIPQLTQVAAESVTLILTRSPGSLDCKGPQGAVSIDLPAAVHRKLFSKRRSYLLMIVKIRKASHIMWEQTMLCCFNQMKLLGIQGLSLVHFLLSLSPLPWLPPILWLLSSSAPVQSCSPFKSILTPNTSLFSQPACPKYFPPALTERVFTGQLQNNKFPFLRRLYGELCGVAAGQRVII